jgi:hypothetical protein
MTASLRRALPPRRIFLNEPSLGPPSPRYVTGYPTEEEELTRQYWEGRARDLLTPYPRPLPPTDDLRTTAEGLPDYVEEPQPPYNPLIDYTEEMLRRRAQEEEMERQRYLAEEQEIIERLEAAGLRDVTERRAEASGSRAGPLRYQAMDVFMTPATQSSPLPQTPPLPAPYQAPNLLEEVRIVNEAHNRYIQGLEERRRQELEQADAQLEEMADRYLNPSGPRLTQTPPVRRGPIGNKGAPPPQNNIPREE